MLSCYSSLALYIYIHVHMNAYIYIHIYMRDSGVMRNFGPSSGEKQYFIKRRTFRNHCCEMPVFLGMSTLIIPKHCKSQCFRGTLGETDAPLAHFFEDPKCIETCTFVIYLAKTQLATLTQSTQPHIHVVSTYLSICLSNSIDISIYLFLT